VEIVTPVPRWCSWPVIAKNFEVERFEVRRGSE